MLDCNSHFSSGPGEEVSIEVDSSSSLSSVVEDNKGCGVGKVLFLYLRVFD